MPKDVEATKPPAPVGDQATAAPDTKRAVESVESQPKTGEPLCGAGGVSVTVDQLAKPGAVVSGKVTFSDGQSSEWYLDELNRLGIVPKQPGYRPSASDVQQFQMALQEALSKY
jgi:hypothetical protein